MTILLRVAGLLKAYVKPDLDEYTRRVTLEGEPTLKELLAQLGIPDGLVAFGYTSDEQVIRMDDRVPDGCTLVLQNPVGGG